jgi:outer membrane protein assembly factor BamD
MSLRNTVVALLGCAALLTGCGRGGFDPRAFTSTDALFSASLSEYERGRWANAARGFERLTTDLPARDPRLATAYFYLGKSQQQLSDHLTAAQTFQRISESFPDDTLAGNALFEAGQSYARLWRRPDLDSQYGRSALNVYRTLLVLYPGSSSRSEAEAEIERLEEWFATKDYNPGYHYMRRGAYDSAIIYFRDVIQQYPNAAKTREAYLRLLEVYDTIRYREDARELCGTMQTRYPGDTEIAQACADVG